MSDSKSSMSQSNGSIANEESCGFEFGFGKCRTKRLPVRLLNCCNCAKGMLLFLCLAVFFQGIVVNGLFNIVESTLEKRFHTRSSEMGFITGCYDYGFLLAVTIVTYVGGRGNKPQWIGCGVFVMGLGSITFSLPHFVAPAYSVTVMQSRLCGDNMTTQECGESHLRVYRAFFIVGQILHGVGSTSLFTLGITYLDANVKGSVSSIYSGVLFSFTALGPAVGFVLGGYFIRLYTNLGEIVEVDQTSPLWIGNWWLGYVVCGAISIVLSIPFIMYPKQLPNTAECRLDRDKEINRNLHALHANDDVTFRKSLLVVLKNTTLVCLSIAGAMDVGTIAALVTFGAKYTEAMFRLTPSQTGIYLGVCSVVAAFSSHLLSGILVSKLKMRVKTMLKMCILYSTLAMGCYFAFLIQCDDPMVPGVNTPHNGKSSFECKGVCGCSRRLYDPICGSDGLTYLSFYEAGCKKSENGYTNCTRVFASDRVISFNASIASSGKCDVSNCPSPVYSIAFASLAIFFTLLKFQPKLQVSLRTVPLNFRSFAIGAQWIIIRCCGTIPMPLILGSLLDSSCLVWENVCDDCGSCKLYDNASMSKFMTIFFVVGKGISIASLLVAFCTYKPPPTDEADARNNGQANMKNGNVEDESYLPMETTRNKSFAELNKMHE